MKVAIRDPAPRDAVRISVIMSRIDIAECRACGHSPLQALVEAEKSSALCWTGEVDGWPHAMFGVAPVSVASGLGAPWFLGSQASRKARRMFLREAPEYLARIEALFPRLEGMVSARNSSAIRWLVHMGFVVEDKATSMRDEPMLRFTKGF